MKSLSIALVAALAASIGASPASANVIDFVAEVASSGEQGVPDGAILNTPAMGSLNLQFSAGAGAWPTDFAYFNSATANGSPAGLGTCTTLDAGAQCNPAFDDVVAANEWVEVGFVDQPFDVRTLSFNGAGNLSLDNDMTGLIKITTSLNSIVAMATLTFAQAATAGFGFVDWIRFEFAGTEFVVASISDVPLPGALPLLLSGLAGLGFAARRKKA
jgi:hypothetical protein